MATQRLTTRQMRALYLIALGGFLTYGDTTTFGSFELDPADYAALTERNLIEATIRDANGIAAVRTTTAGVALMCRNPARLRRDVYALTQDGNKALFERTCTVRPADAPDYRMPQAGDAVQYRGSLAEMRGPATVVRDCGCRECVRGSIPQMRFVLRTDSGELLHHVAERSFTGAALAA